MSRLETSGKSVRDRLITRNRYNSNNIYDINNSTVVDIINTTINFLNPSNGFDFSNTVIGRIVGPNTPIAKIGNQALVNLFAKQVSSTLVRKNIPTVNLNNLFNGKDVISKNIDYSITKETSDNIQEKILNSLRYSTSSSSSINPIVSDDQYTLVSKYTGNGQKNTLEKLLSQNLYSNNIFGSLNYNNSSTIDNIKSNSNIDSIIKSIKKNINFSNIDTRNLISHFDKRYESKIYPLTGDTINQQNIDEKYSNLPKDFTTWGETLPSSPGILGYTNALFLTLSDNSPFNKTVGQITVNGKDYYNGNKYRNFSSINQYNSISKSIKSNGSGKTNSVIKDSIIPQFIFKNPTGITGGTNTVMFSIENLAINHENIDKYFNDEVGPNGGRLMWFMPSIETLSENVKPNVTSTNFLGRGEPVYTYSNTERTLDLTFWMVIDYVQDFINVTSVSEFLDKVYNNSKQQIDSAQTNTNVINEELILKRENDLKKQKDYLKNKSNEYSYDNLPIDFYYKQNSIYFNNISSNPDYQSNIILLLNSINEYLKSNENKIINIITKTTFSKDAIAGDIETRKKIDKLIYSERVTDFNNYLVDFINQSYPIISNKINIVVEESIQDDNYDINQSNNSLSQNEAKKRKSSIIAVIPTSINESLDINNVENTIQDNTNAIIEETNVLDEQTVTGSRSFVDDNLLKLKDYKETQDQNLINNSNSKIITKTIQNGFMSYTPYDLYKRLTFLHQCTRQGRTKLKDDSNISNSVFGRPPFIVFKLGDMYNTKAIIDQLTISFENDIPWDLNPEGFGVQKMGCKVTLNMKLIGGSSLEGYKSHILNGESRRFYANSSFEGIKDIEE
jgi:hypothetical protein